MQRSSDIGTGAYASGRPYISVWSLVNGHPRCVEAPLSIANGNRAELAATIARNRALTVLCLRAEAVEAATSLAAQQEPAAELAFIDADGQPITLPNPAHATWMAATALLAQSAAEEPLQHLLRTRSDSLQRDEFGLPAEEAFSFDLPPVPSIPDPLTQTADWNGLAWQVRALTADELASWPLRPASSLDKMRFARLLRDVVGDALAATVLTQPAINLTLTLAGRVDWTDIFVGTDGNGPSHAQQLVDAGAVTPADVESLKASWPLAAGD